MTPQGNQYSFGLHSIFEFDNPYAVCPLENDTNEIRFLVFESTDSKEGAVTVRDLLPERVPTAIHQALSCLDKLASCIPLS
jgi:hypothetical protein